MKIPQLVLAAGLIACSSDEPQMVVEKPLVPEPVEQEAPKIDFNGYSWITREGEVIEETYTVVFAELRLDGKNKLSVTAVGGFPLSQLVENLVKENKLVLETALRNGDITHVKFTYVDYGFSWGSFTPAYTNGGEPDHFVAIDIPYEDREKNSSSEMNVTLGHESMHALGWGHGLSDGVASVDRAEKEWSALCESIRTQALAVYPELSQSNEWNDFLRMSTNPQFDNARKAVTQDIARGNFREHQANKPDSNRFLTDYPVCQTLNTRMAVIRLLVKRGQSEHIRSALDEDDLMSAMMALEEVEEEILRTESIYSPLYEKSYNEENKGHPGENWDELFASTANIALLFPNEMHEKIASLPEGQRTILEDLVGMVLDVLAKKKDPSGEFKERIERSRRIILS